MKCDICGPEKAEVRERRIVGRSPFVECLDLSAVISGIFSFRQQAIPISIASVTALTTNFVIQSRRITLAVETTRRSPDFDPQPTGRQPRGDLKSRKRRCKRGSDVNGQLHPAPGSTR